MKDFWWFFKMNRLIRKCDKRKNKNESKQSNK